MLKLTDYGLWPFRQESNVTDVYEEEKFKGYPIYIIVECKKHYSMKQLSGYDSQLEIFAMHACLHIYITNCDIDTYGGVLKRHSFRRRLQQLIHLFQRTCILYKSHGLF